jgi:hypothetical protein
VQQAVDATEIHEGAVVGEVLDHAVEVHAFLQRFEQGIALGGILLLEHGAAGHHHVVAALIELDDLEFEFLAFEVGDVAHRAHVHQRAGKEGADAVDIDGEATLDLALQEAWDLLLLLEGLFEDHPDFGAARLLTGQAGLAETVVDGLHGDLHLIADGEVEVAFFVEELGLGDDAFRLQAGVDGDPIVIDVDHGAGDDGARGHLDGLQTFFEQFREGFAHVEWFPVLPRVPADTG